jgi:hypothetical protein
MSNIFDMEASAMAAIPFRERLLYGNLLADLAVYIPYVVRDAHTNSLSRIAGTMLLLTLVQIVIQIIIAIATHNRVQDERDTLISLRGYRAGYFAFGSCIFLGLGMLWLHQALGLVNPAKMAIHFLSVMFGMLVIADVVRVVTQLINYRRAV